MQFTIFAAMFYASAVIITNSMEKKMVKMPNGVEEEMEIPSVDPEDVFIATFAIMNGAMQVGSAMAMGPDMGKAGAAAKRIFGIVETPSKINAIEIENDKSLKKVDYNTFKGEIKFEHVWFRYPTRPEDFVLRDFNIHIKQG